MALWRTRILIPEQKAQISEEQQDEEKAIALDDGECVLSSEVAKMSKIYGSELPIGVSDLFS